MNTKHKTVIYVRSSRAGKLDDVRTQKDRCKSYISAVFDDVKNVNDIPVYADENLSSVNLDKMIEDVKNGNINNVIVSSLGCVAHHDLGLWGLIILFRQNNARLIAINENIDTSSAVCDVALEYHSLFSSLDDEDDD